MHHFINNLLVGISVTDIIDIIIVAFLIYKLLDFIRESRAEQLVKGIIVLLIIAFLADVCHLYTLNWILKAILAVGVIALVVIFQPELRRALERMGQGRIFKSSGARLNKERAKDVATEIVEAVEDMAFTRTGALIVFERATSLMNICETGTFLDAEISTSLIENIFYKGSPLHDGALIVRRDRLLAAGCVLPLTENQSLPKNLGTRHRAGIGVTEVSDAATVIVSEETGIVSLAQNGKLERYLDGKTLEKRLLAVFLGYGFTESEAGFKAWLERVRRGH